MAEYINGPDAHDNLGLLYGLPENMRQKLIEGRINKLQREIDKFRNEIEKLRGLLDEVQ